MTIKFIRVYIAVIIAGCIMVMISCSAPKTGTAVSKPIDNLLTDRDGNTYHLKLLADGNLWMTANLNLNVSGSYCYENATANCEKYGRLYTWETAAQVCSQLGQDWQLPSKDDWLQLTMLYGGNTEAITIARKGAFTALLPSGNSGFNAVLGGGRTLDSNELYTRGDAHGFYWTATETDSTNAWFANFAKGSQALYLQPDGEKPRAFSVRCVKYLK